MIETLPFEKDRRRERAERILDIAQELLLKHGYRRITIDDVARQSGIGKGTIYLHWKSKEELFGTILLRETVTIWKELIHRVGEDPNLVRFSEVMRTMMLIGMQRPLARAFFTADREPLGKLMESKVGPRQQAEHLVGQNFFQDVASARINPGRSRPSAVKVRAASHSYRIFDGIATGRGKQTYP